MVEQQLAGLEEAGGRGRRKHTPFQFGLQSSNFSVSSGRYGRRPTRRRGSVFLSRFSPLSRMNTSLFRCFVVASIRRVDDDLTLLLLDCLIA